MATTYLRFADLKARNIVRHRMTLWRWIAEGRFPKPIRLGPNTVGWPSDEIEAWDAERRAERDSSPEAA